MSSFRLRVESLEARDNPASPTDVALAEAFAESNRELLAFIQSGPGYYSDQDKQAGTQIILDTIADRSRLDAAVLREYAAALQQQIAANPSLDPVLFAELVETVGNLLQTEANGAAAGFQSSYISLLVGDTGAPFGGLGGSTGGQFLGGTGTNLTGGNAAGLPGNLAGGTTIDPATATNADGSLNVDAITQQLNGQGGG